MAKYSLGQSVGVSIQTGEIDDSAVTTDKIADSAVTSDKINAFAVTTGKLATNSVDHTKLKDDVIEKEEINAGTETALQVLRLNAAGDGLEWGTAALDADDTVTIGGASQSLKNWLISLG